ncbi:MAG: nicotinate-nucleotide--dimethylbenzimidazole phosphoribosyltransferase [Rhodospirillales bacterium]|nr:nicotinate-nucleotide--dimethylbenzimidazole phosphoribosyltransferase [Rhodospirillales bacterium]
MPEPVASFAEILALVPELPGPDLDSATKAAAREAQLTKPGGALGRLEEIAGWMSTWQAAHPARINRPRVAVFAANHGIAARGVSAYPAEVTAQMVQNFVAGGAAVNQLCTAFDAELRVYEMALEKPTADFAAGPAMDEGECARAIAYGMMAVEPGIDLLCLGEMGIANTTSASALCVGLFGGSAEDWVGPGTGVAGEAMARKKDAVDLAARLHFAEKRAPLDVLARVGGYELAAIVGAVLAARLARVPVLLDGFACTVAGAIVHALDPRGLDHCQVAHMSAEPGHRRLLDRLGRRPLFDFGMRLGEASGAALAIAVVRAALACHNGMATFADAGVAGKA